jgi:hypothetical protein
MPKGPNYELDYNYHSHTWRCGHATGTDEVLCEIRDRQRLSRFMVSPTT